MIKIYIVSPEDSQVANRDPQFSEAFRQSVVTSDFAKIVRNPSDADVTLMVEQWDFKGRAYIPRLLDDSFLSKYASKVFVINFDDFAAGFWPGCYTSLSLKNFDWNFHRACIYPRTYNEFTSAPDVHANSGLPYLYSFQGTLHSSVVREEMFRLLGRDPRGLLIDVTQDFHSHTVEQKKDYVRTIRSSEFVLCPRGASPSTYRLYETMRQGRCPVIVSDAWVAPEEVAWSNCSIRVKQAEMAQLPMLLELKRDQAFTLGENARKAWETHFSKERRYLGYLHKILSIKKDLPHMDINDYQHVWYSRTFRKRNGWAFHERLLNRLKGLFER